MTAAELSTEERAEVDRFEIHDLDKIDTLTCTVCESPAWWLVQMRCCPGSSTLCTWHKVLHRSRHEKRLTGRSARCEHCGHLFPAGVTFDDIFKVRKI